MQDSKLISCKIATKLMSKSFEKKLSLKEESTLKRHLAICKTCAYCFHQVKGLKKTLALYNQRILQIPVPSKKSLSTKSRKKMKSLIENEINN